MSILDKASLIQIPSGYKNGKLYSVKPTPTYGSELVTNGDFATDSDWTKQSSWTIGGGLATYDAVVNSHYIQQNLAFISGKEYKFTFTVSGGSGNSRIGFYSDNNIVVGISGYSNGTHTVYGTANIVGLNLRIFAASSGGAFSIDNVSVKEVFENDVPRLDYSDGSCASLLLEPQRTNLLPYSDFSSGFTTTNVTLSNNQGTSPDGTSNATKALMASGTGSHRVYDAISSSLNDDNVISVFIKEQNDISHIGLAADTMSNQVWFSGSDGSIINANGLDAKTESFGNGWHRISVHYVADSNDTGDNQFIYFSNRENNSPNVAFDGTEEILLYGIQAEKGKYLTSLINTEGSTVTRTADVCNNAGTSATFNDSEGVLFFEGSTLVESGITRVISLSDGSTSNNIYFNFNQNANSFNCEVLSGGSGQFNASVTITKINNNKIALKYKANDFALWINGTEVATDTSGSAPSGLDRLNFDFGQGIFDFEGKCKQLMVFNEALSDEELSDLTGQINLSFNNLATFYNYTIL
jgi:hypothetical protein